MHDCVLSCVLLIETPWTAAGPTLLSMGFSRQEYRSGWPFPLPGDHPNPGIKPTSPALASVFFTTEAPGKSSRTYNVASLTLDR